MGCDSPLKGYRNMETGGIVFKKSSCAGEKMEVACGQCLRCRIDRSCMWAMRLVHEATLWEGLRGNSFVTLTYDDDHLPDDWSLRVSDFQKFAKRLRKKYGGTIRYFHTGEYGQYCRHKITVDQCEMCNVGRPHYHAILFNVAFGDLRPIGCHNGIDYFTSDELRKVWQQGNVQVGEVNYETTAYVARYCMKKITGLASDTHYANVSDDGELIFVLPEYCTMSRRPGIGRNWFQKYSSDVYPSDETPIPGRGVVPTVPRYYDELLRQDNPELLEQVKKLRAAFKRHHPELFTPEKLLAKHLVKRAQVNQLKRSLK